MTNAVPAPTGFSFRTWPFYWLARAAGHYIRNMETALDPDGLDIPRWRVLMVLHEEGQASVGEIADHAIVKLSTMTRIVQRMQSDNLVRCYPRASDARVTEVALTEAGTIAGEQAWRAAKTVYERAFRGMSKRDIATLDQLLNRVVDNLDLG